MAASIKITEKDKISLEWIRHKILSDITVHHTIDWLSEQTGLNQLKIKQGLKRVYGITPFGLLAEARIEKSIILLTTTTLSVNEIAKVCGYMHTTNFISAFRRKLSTTPDRYRLENMPFDAVLQAARIIDESLNKHHTSDSLSKKLEVPRIKLQTAFRKEFGMGVYHYLRVKRMEKVRELIVQGKDLGSIANQVGYKSISILYITFWQIYNIRLTDWISTTRGKA